MFEEILIRHCSPTLAGLKTGSIFVFRYESTDRLFSLLREYNARLSPKGIRMVLLRKRDTSALIYVYRPKRLTEDLKNREAASILADSGYLHPDPASCLIELKQRLNESDGFPHEIGLFLGYPPEDVRGFIQNKGKCSKCCGCWKVYGDVEKSKQCFARFRKCRKIYYLQWSMGKSVEHLTVSA